VDAIARITARAGHTPWWNDRWAWRGAFAFAPLGALAAILHALVVLRVGFGEALTAYGVGALVAAGIGCLLGGPLGAAGCALRERLRRHDPAVEVAAAEEAAYAEHQQRTYATA
jgi:hypothetical protein